MKISILLPYKENFSPIYPGAVSLFVKDTSNVSKYKKNIVVLVTHHLKKNLTLNISILIYLTLNLQAKANNMLINL